MVLANLRVQHGPLVATLVEGHHEGALHAACGRSRVPGVMTTTLRVNAQELQVSTTVEENARNAPACGSRAASSKPTIASAWLKSFNPLFRRAGSIEVPLTSAHRGGLELGTGTGLYGACRSTQCCLAVRSRWCRGPVRA